MSEQITEAAEQALPVCSPPAPWHRHEWHWLHSWQSSSPVLAQWMILRQCWATFGEIQYVTPQEMRRRGWEWFAPAIPPKHPIYDE